MVRHIQLKIKMKMNESISIAKGGGTIFVYDTNGSLVNSFNSARKAAVHFNSSHATIKRYCLNRALFQNKWILSTTNLEIS